MPNIQAILDARVTDAIRAAYPDSPEAADAEAILMPAQDARFGDYQANGAMALGKRMRTNPRELAEAIARKIDLSDMAEPPEIAGPGFINIRLRPDWVAARTGEAVADERLSIPEVGDPETIVVDYSSPNLAKEMHVGHLRSTIIGDALVRLLAFLGHDVERQNHVGDWGTQFGMLVAHMKDLAREEGSWEEAAPELADLETFYREAKRKFDASPEFAERARAEVTRLQGGEAETLEMWRRFREISLDHCHAIYARLGVLLSREDVRGESAYNDDLPRVVEALANTGLLTESDGAQCVFLDDFTGKDGSPLPVIVEKSAGGYLYATSDLAAIRYRFGSAPDTPEWGPADRSLYVTDARQALHFRQVFAVAREAGFVPDEAELDHVPFGTMMGTDGKPFKTREGGTVKLTDLLDEAESRALDLVTDKNPDLSDEERGRIARIVGIGAVKYADLAQNRTSDYVFSWDKMLSLQGNTAPYMQYAYARIRSIFRRGDARAEPLRADTSPLAVTDDVELALAKKILQLPETLARAASDYRPNVLAAYLYDLAQAFTGFYEACPVLKSEEPVRTARLKLCDLTARTIRRGLNLLGIETADRM